MRRTINVLLVTALVAFLSGCCGSSKHTEKESDYCDDKTSTTYKK
jgi:uncharacterized lipoprotein